MLLPRPRWRPNERRKLTLRLDEKPGDPQERRKLNLDLDEKPGDLQLWAVPKQRMKAGAVHEVPLSSIAVALPETLHLKELAPMPPFFAVRGAQRSNMAMAMLLRRMDRDVTTHGFRSTFRDWAGDATSYSRDLIEPGLAHTFQNKAERYYRRGTAA